MVFTNEEGWRYLQEMNTHICKKCGEKFVNFKGMNEHVRKFKHYEFKLQGTDLTCMYV